MAKELELSDYVTMHPPAGWKGTDTTSGDPKQYGRRIFRIGLLTLGLLCIIQVTLNISLRLALYSKEDIDQFPFNSSVIADLCQIDQSLQNSTQLCSCCNNLLRRLFRQYVALKTERDLLQDEVSRLRGDRGTKVDDLEGSGSGFLEDNFNPDRSWYS